MTLTTWTRDAGKVQAALTLQADKSAVTSKPLKLYVPERYVEKKLVKIGSEIYVVGIFALVVEDKYYAVSTTNAMMRIKPTTISTVKFEEDSYLEFAFEPGSVVFATTELIRTDTLVYYIFDEFIAKGRVPWYIEYEDLAKLFLSSDKHAGVRLGGQHAILEMFAAAIARDPNQRSRYYRQSLSDKAGANEPPPKFIPLRSIVDGATNTTSRLLGSYWNDGLNSALIHPSDKTERVEELLRR